MSIPFSYFTTNGMGKIRWKIRWFHAKFQDKNKKWKNKYKTMFSYKMVNSYRFWIFFALALPTHVFDPFLSILFYYRMLSVRQHDLNRLVCTSSAGLHWTSFYGGRVNLMMWRIRLGSVPTLHVRDLSGPHRSFIAFTPSASVEGGCKRIGRIPRVMRSHSR